MKLPIPYIAGYLDADGSISASLTLNKRSLKNRSCLQFSVQVCGQNADVLGEIMETLECGEIRAYVNSGYKTSGAYRYDIPTPDIERVLNLLIPYLRLKRTQAEVVLAMLKTRSRGSHRVTDAVMELRQQLIATLHRLNGQDSEDYRKKWVNSVEPPYNSLVSKYGAIPSQAAVGVGNIVPFSSAEGVTTSPVSPNNTLDHEPPPRKGRDSLASNAS